MLKSTVHLHKFSNLAHHTYNSKPPAFTAKPPNPFILTPSHLSHQKSLSSLYFLQVLKHCTSALNTAELKQMDYILSLTRNSV